MPTDQHAEQRIDRARRDAWLAELWPPCRELSSGERAAKREEDRRQQKLTEEWAVTFPQDNAVAPQEVA